MSTPGIFANKGPEQIELDSKEYRLPATAVVVNSQESIFGSKALEVNNFVLSGIKSAIYLKKQSAFSNLHSYDKQFVKSSSSLCPGAYEHAL